MIKDLEAINFDPETDTSSSLYDKLESKRKEILLNKISDALSNSEEPKATDISIYNESINLNFLGNKYVIDISNTKDLI